MGGHGKIVARSAIGLSCSGSPNITGKIAVAQSGSLLAMVDGYGQGRYTSIHWSGDTLMFEIANKRKGELRLSPDGKTLIEKGYVRRTFSIGGYFSGVDGVSIDRGRHGAHSGQAPPQMTGFTGAWTKSRGRFIARNKPTCSPF
jgi:hypothetical protein